MFCVMSGWIPGESRASDMKLPQTPNHPSTWGPRVSCEFPRDFLGSPSPQKLIISKTRMIHSRTSRIYDLADGAKTWPFCMRSGTLGPERQANRAPEGGALPGHLGPKGSLPEDSSEAAAPARACECMRQQRDLCVSGAWKVARLAMLAAPERPVIAES